MLSTWEKVQVLQHAMKILDIKVAAPRGHWVSMIFSDFFLLTLNSDEPKKLFFFALLNTPNMKKTWVVVSKKFLLKPRTKGLKPPTRKPGYLLYVGDEIDGIIPRYPLVN